MDRVAGENQWSGIVTQWESPGWMDGCWVGGCELLLQLNGDNDELNWVREMRGLGGYFQETRKIRNGEMGHIQSND